MTTMSQLVSRNRTLAVIFLCALSMVVCLLWWDRIPFHVMPQFTTAKANNTSLREKPSRNGDSTTPPPLLFQSSKYSDNNDDDDEREFVGEDDDYVPGLKIRGNDKNNDKKQKSSSTEPASSPTSSSTPASSLPSSSSSSSSSTTNQKRPKMVWLMSYPNSGTSYTMRLVARLSQRAIASNYGREMTNPPTPNTPLYPGQWNGPFYRPQPKRPLPEDYILVKTHCGGKLASRAAWAKVSVLVF